MEITHVEPNLEIAPSWFVFGISELIKKPVRYVEEKSADPAIDPDTGFGCWGFVWFCFCITGETLPKDVYEAQKLFAEVGRPQFRDVASYENQMLFEKIHLGFMESPTTMLHCSHLTNGIARADINRAPWAGKLKFHRLKLN